MASDWRLTTLDRLGRIVTGKTPASGRSRPFGGEIPFVTPADFDGRRVIDSTARCLTDEGVEALVRAAIPSRAVMVTCIGSDLGKAAIAGRECVTNQQINSIIVTSGDDPFFVYYNLSMRKDEIRTSASGSAQPILNKSTFGRLNIRLPPPVQQRGIVAILGAFDEKLELNRQIIASLDATIHTIFKSWFVNFDPVRARSKGYGPGLPQAIADLFPSGLDKSEIGPIPHEWDVLPLQSVLTVRNERAGRLELPEYSSTNNGLQLRAERFKKRLTRSPQNNKVVRAGDLVFGLSRRRLNFGLMRDELGSVSPAYRVYAVDRHIIEPETLERIMRANPAYFYGAVSASSREGQAISAEALSMLKFARPPTALQRAYEDVIRPFRNRKRTASAESQTLSMIRDALAPRLLSGDIRVPQAERILEAAPI
jgi:type I restriction enzyme S subunit